MIRITFLQASLIALAVMLLPAAAQGAFTPDQVWTLSWETYVDLQPGNSNVLSTNWDYALNKWEEVYVDGDGVDNQPGGDDLDEHQGEAAEGWGDNPLGLDELSMTLTGLTPSTSYAVDAVVMAESGSSSDNWGALVSFTSGTLGATAFDCGNKTAAHINMDFNNEWLARSPVGTTMSSASGEITVYFNENGSLDWTGSRGGTIADGLIYAKVSDITPMTPLITSADRKNGVTDNDPPIGVSDGDTDPLASDDYGLRLGARTFSDRVFHVDDISDGLVGADYVRNFLNDKSDAEGDFSYDVTLTQDLDEVFLMLLIDDRFEEGNGELQAAVDLIVAGFAGAGDFVDTELDVDFSDSSTPHPLSAFGMMVPTKDGLGDPITYTFGATPSGASSTYLIAALEEAPELPRIPGDANGDRKVDAADVSIMAANWGSAGASWAMGDFSEDGTVGPEDAKILAQNWGTDNSSNEAASTIPEPSIAVMLLALLPVLWLRRQR